MKCIIYKIGININLTPVAIFFSVLFFQTNAFSQTAYFTYTIDGDSVRCHNMSPPSNDGYFWWVNNGTGSQGRWSDASDQAFKLACGWNSIKLWVPYDTSNIYVVEINIPNSLFIQYFYSSFNSTVKFITVIHASRDTNLTYYWDFGDGQTSTEKNPTHEYPCDGYYTPMLRVTDDVGCSKEYSNYIYLNLSQNVYCSFDWLPYQNTVYFSASEGPGYTYLWDFGDGETSSEINPIHTYSCQQDYDVWLTVTTPQGCEGTAYRSVSTFGSTYASFKTVIKNDTVNFINRSGGSNLQYSWDFGDDSTSTLSNPTHIYACPGFYLVSLRVFSRNPCAEVYARKFITVNGNIHAKYGYNINNKTVSFSDSSIGNHLSYLWDFGDNTTSTLKNPSHTYICPGDYYVQLTVTDINNCSMDYGSTINIDGLTAEYSYVINGNTANFLNTSTASRWRWDFKNGDTSSLQNPSHTYPHCGVYTVSLRVSDNQGCNNEFAQEVYIQNNMVLNATSNSPVCPDSTLILLSNNLSASKFVWYGPNNFYSYNTNTEIRDITKSDEGTYYIYVEDGYGCPRIDSVRVEVGPNTDVRVSGDTIIALANNATYQWINCANNTPILGQTNKKFIPHSNGNYAVIVTSGGCSDTSVCNTIGLVGIRQNNTQNITVFPNPTSDKISLAGINEISSIKIIDATGRVVLNTEFTTNLLDLSYFSAGVYILKIETTQGTSQHIVIKQ